MRTPFLKQIARHYCVAGRDISSLTFVFPSQRAVVFFRKYIAEVVSEEHLGAVICPGIISVEEFLSASCELSKADNVTLLLDLFSCYNQQRVKVGLPEELLDDFIFWGDVILSDFNDIDKYLVNAVDLLRNVRDLKDIDGDLSYLSPSQRKALERFLGMFNTGGEYKERFARIWQLLGPLYESYNQLLLSKGYAYEGARYRNLAMEVERLGARSVFKRAFPGTEKIVFCGFNALNECEKKIMVHLRDLEMADFCWDYVSPLIKDPSNKSSLFLSENIKMFPPPFPLESCGEVPEIEVISVPSAIGQTKVLSTLLSDLSVSPDEHTAVVLPDESLLLPLLNSVPPEVENINVTMGYPLLSSSFFSLLENISQLQLHIRDMADPDKEPEFFHRQVWAIFSNNIFAALCDDRTRGIVSDVKKARRYYVPASSLNGTPLLDVVFKRADKLDDYLSSVFDFIGRSICSDETLKGRFSLELDFAMECIKTINLLTTKDMQLSPRAYLSLLTSLLRSKSIPFKGEPLKGLQVLGPLEMRSLDFDTLFILSCNEGTFPRRNVSSSFIPPLLRRGFSLPAYEYQDAVWAYYFYRMIQRPAKVYLILDNRTEGLKSGEESRYIKQLEYAFNVSVSRRGVKAIPGRINVEDQIPKTARHIEIIHNSALSATSLKNYLTCPVKFYYSFIEKLSVEDEVVESMDASMVGTVYHKVMQLLYSNQPGNHVTGVYLNSLLEGKENIRTLVRRTVMDVLNADMIHGRDIIVTEMIFKYVCKTVERDIELLKSHNREYFVIEGLEKYVEGEFDGFRLKGFIDRLDSFENGVTRIVDYKTGKVLKDDIDITDSTAQRIASKIFDPSCKDRPEIAFQFFIYDYLIRLSPGFKNVILQNSVYSTRKILGECPVNVNFNTTFYGLMCQGLSSLLKEISDPDIGFKRTGNTDHCALCDFKTICSK